MKVLQISQNDAFTLRKRVLLEENQNKSSSEQDDQNIHLGGFIDGQLVTVASFHFERHPDITEENQFHLKGVATDPRYQKQGYMTELIQTALPMMKRNFTDVVWCEAKNSSKSFYEKLDFNTVEITSGPFLTRIKINPFSLSRSEKKNNKLLMVRKLL